MKIMPPARTLLVADVGGTNTRVALATGQQLRSDTIERYRHRRRLSGGRRSGARWEWSDDQP